MSTILDNETLFEQNSSIVFIAAGDVTNDGATDLIVTTCCDARAAVFQGQGNSWDGGALLAGPSLTVAARPIIAPIHGDGLNWLVYTEHLGGNNGQWLRAHHYDGVNLAENQDIAARVDWPGHQAPAVGDLDKDGTLDIWYVENYGEEPDPTLHLFRRTWDPATASYPGGEIKDGVVRAETKIRPVAGDFLGNGGASLIWLSQPDVLELVTYTPGEGVDNYTSTPIYQASETVQDFHAGEYDDQPGTDIAIVTWDGTVARAYTISGGSFSTDMLGEAAEMLTSVRMGDADGDGQGEVYAAGRTGGVYGEGPEGWGEIAAYEGIEWQDGAILRPDDADRDEVLFVGSRGGTAFLVIRIAQ